MSETSPRWIKKSELKRFTFNEVEVNVMQCELAGETWWWISASFPPKNCWVHDGKIFGRSEQLLCDPPDVTRNPLAEVPDMDADEERAIFMAIAECEK